MGARVIVTGGARGIGAAAIAQLRGRGASVLALDLDAEAQDVIACDVRDQASVDRAVGEALERLGGLDALVNNAGVGMPQSAAAPPGEDAQAVIDVNLLGPWRVTSAAIGALRKSRGRVINVASGLAFLSVPFGPAYCMSKRGLVAYSDALRYEVGGEVSVTTVYPGYLRTAIWEGAEQEGLSLEGLVPEESVEEVAARIVRAALERPVRDLAGSRSGAAAYAALRRAPGRLVDRVVMTALRRHARAGAFDRSRLAADYVRALRNRS